MQAQPDPDLSVLPEASDLDPETLLDPGRAARR